MDWLTVLGFTLLTMNAWGTIAIVSTTKHTTIGVQAYTQILKLLWLMQSRRKKCLYNIVNSNNPLCLSSDYVR